ncbi:MAG: mono/diheme cytochrome c family protein, partial [Candidatus Promineifilaceae bacterium]
MKFYVLILAFCAGVLNTAQAEKITYVRHIRPLFQDNCFKCHNPDKEKGGLNLTTMSAVMAGGGSGQVVAPGDPDDSLLYLQMTHAEEPFMPPKSSKRPDAELALVRKWIEGGLLETDSSVARVAKRPSAALAQADVSLDRPEGPAPMPVDLPLEAVHVLQRADAIIALAANPWAPVTAAGSENQVLLHHSGTRDLVGVLPFPEGAIYDVRFSRNGQLLLVAGGAAGKDGAVVIFDARSGERLLDLRAGYDAVLSADVSADQRDVVIGGTDR